MLKFIFVKKDPRRLQYKIIMKAIKDTNSNSNAAMTAEEFLKSKGVTNSDLDCGEYSATIINCWFEEYAELYHAEKLSEIADVDVSDAAVRKWLVEKGFDSGTVDYACLQLAEVIRTIMSAKLAEKDKEIERLINSHIEHHHKPWEKQFDKEKEG